MIIKPGVSKAATIIWFICTLLYIQILWHCLNYKVFSSPNMPNEDCYWSFCLPPFLGPYKCCTVADDLMPHTPNTPRYTPASTYHSRNIQSKRNRSRNVLGNKALCSVGFGRFENNYHEETKVPWLILHCGYIIDHRTKINLTCDWNYML